MDLLLKGVLGRRSDSGIIKLLFYGVLRDEFCRKNERISFGLSCFGIKRGSEGGVCFGLVAIKGFEPIRILCLEARQIGKKDLL